MRFVLLDSSAGPILSPKPKPSFTNFWFEGMLNEGFGLGDGAGPLEESKGRKHIQGWSRQIGLGTLFAIHCKLFSI